MTRLRWSLFLLGGDIVALVAGFSVALLVRYGRSLDVPLFLEHARLFAPLFVLWLVVYFGADLYRPAAAVFRRRIAGTLVRAHLVAVLFTVPILYASASIPIRPRGTLVLIAFATLVALLVWRLRIAATVRVVRPERTAFLAQGPDFEELKAELSRTPRYGFEIVDAGIKEILKKQVTTVVLDLGSHKTRTHAADLHPLLARGVRFIDAHRLYEEIFDRLPLSVLEETWFLDHISGRSKRVYDRAKRLLDLALALPAFLLSLPFYPLVALAIKLEDDGPVFIEQERVGRLGKPLLIRKFRSMSGNDEGKYGAGGATTLRVTRVGAFLRASRIDELPQLWAVVTGSLSLVGPRPELPSLAALYQTEIHFYDFRHLITPGLSGWAQIYQEHHPHHASAVASTREKLAYDLFYLKNRSFLVDVKIIVKTIKTLLSIAGI